VKPVVEKLTLFQAHSRGYDVYRIPAIVVTARGTVLAFCGARGGSSDWAPIDILLRRSTDGGMTWQRPQVVASAAGCTVDNATPILDRLTGAVHLLYQVNYARCFYTCSQDDGGTFSIPAEITGVFEQFRGEYDWNVIAPGPGHGLQMVSGRLVVPVWLSTGGRAHRPSIVAVIYSDDHGRAWQRGDVVVGHSADVPNPSETVALQLEDGRVMLNIRNESPRHRRLVSCSTDGVTGWSEPAFDEELFEPICFASLVRLTTRVQGGRGRILFANPDYRDMPKGEGDWRLRRQNLTVRLSYDDGETWPIARVLDAGPSGYSDLAATADGTVFCLYESAHARSDIFADTDMAAARFNLVWLTNGADRLG
jgi:sialidase-1